MRLQLLRYVAVLALIAAVAKGATPDNANVTSCKTAVLPTFPGHPDETAECVDKVGYLIPNTLNETIEDYFAWYQAEVQVNCPFYGGATYQCRKHFPQCVPQTSGPPIVKKLCRADCYRAKTWDHSSCGRFVDEYFQEECGDNRYYSDDTANCVNIGPGEPDDAQTWKYVLVGVLGGIGLILLGSYLRGRWRERMSEEDLDKEQEARERRKAAAEAAKADKYQGLQMQNDPEGKIASGAPPSDRV